jgi:ABC-type nitrate/sulfonate/bicarbonate transport system substrate-binding protein
MPSRFVSVRRVLIAAALLLVVAPLPGHAADKIRLGKGINILFTLLPADVGIAEGMYAKYGLDVEITTLTGDAKLQAALTSDSVDMGFGGGPTMAFAAKGAPEIGVASLVGAPTSFSVILAKDSPIKTVDDLKGKLLAVASNGSVPQWLIRRLSSHQGWGPDGIRTNATGAFEASLAATLTHQVDGFMGATEAGYQLEENGRGRILVGMAQFVPDFITQVIFTRKDFVEKHPDQVERFLKGTFAAVAFMKANKEKTVALAAKALNQSTVVMSKTYDYEIASILDDGAFNPKAVAMLKDSFIEMGTLTEKPKDEVLFTTKFTPVKP